MSVPLTRESLVDQIARRVTEDILTGRYPPGSLLPPERDLAAEYGVTRTSLKHTLVRLEQAGLISTRHGVGSTVRDFQATGGAGLLPMLLEAGSEGWLDDVFEARRLVGALIAREAATSMDGATEAMLATSAEALSAATTAAEVQLVEADVHRLLARATGNRVFVLLTNTLIDSYMTLAPLLEPAFTDIGPVTGLLARVVDAVRRRDPDAAAAASDRYLSETGAAMGRLLHRTQTAGRD